MRANRIALASVWLAWAAQTSAFGGILTIQVPGSADSRAQAGAVHPDGSFVAAGFASFSRGTDTAVMRFTPAEALDTDWRDNGIAVDSMVGSSDEASACVIRNDGKVVVSGYAATPRAGSFGVMRYDADGRVDRSFGSKGKATFSYSRSTNSVPTSMMELPDHRLVIGGHTYGGGIGLLAMVMPEGTLDKSFGDGGWKALTILGEDRFHAVTSHFGKIAAAGYGRISPASFKQWVVARFELDGSLDGGFGSGGVAVMVPPGMNAATAFAMTEQSDGKLLVAGQSEGPSAPAGAWTVARYESNGALDPSFGSGGIVIIPSAPNEGYHGHAVGIAQQPDGRIVLAGRYTPSGGTSYFATLRLNADGGIDPTYHGGSFSLALAKDHAVPKAMALDPDGKVLVFGYSSDSSGVYTTIVRYGADGSL